MSSTEPAPTSSDVVERTHRAPDWRVAAAMAALVLAIGVVVLRFAYLAGTSLTYDEATYVDVAAHPWWSAYYPDAVFVRHPPLFFLIMWPWVHLVGDTEIWLRLPSLAFTTAALGFTWDATRRRGGLAAATLAGVLSAASFLVLVYGIQFTMYPLAFLLASVGVWGRSAGRLRTERAAWVLLALTHMFGFVVLAVRLWTHRRDWRSEALVASPALAWFAVAAVVGVAAGGARTGSGLGPTWQVVRGFELFWALVTDLGEALRHAWVYVLAILLLNPVLLYGAWDVRGRWGPWAYAGLALAALFLPGPPFLRFGLLALPLVLVPGIAGSFERAGVRRTSTIALAIGLASLTAGTAYVNAGIDPNAGNDVPGLADWEAAAERIAAGNVTQVATPATPPVAHYLTARHGWPVVDASDGPDRLVLADGDGDPRFVARAVTGLEFRERGEAGFVLLVPQTWTGVQADLFRADFQVCGRVEGVLLIAAPDVACPAP